MTDPQGIETSGTKNPSNAGALEGFLLTHEERNHVYGLIREQYRVLGLDPSQFPSQANRSQITAAKCCLIAESAGRRLQSPPLANDPNDDLINRRESIIISGLLQSKYAELGLDPELFPHILRRFDLDYMECLLTAEILVRFLRRVQVPPLDSSQPPGPRQESQTTLEKTMRECSTKALAGLMENADFESLLRNIIREEIRPAIDSKPGNSVENTPKVEPTIHFKSESGKTWVWKGSGSPSTGDGKWIQQTFKKWPPSTPVNDPPQQSSRNTQ